MAIKQLTEADKALLDNVGVKSLPDNLKQYSAAQIKSAIRRPSLLLFDWAKLIASNAQTDIEAETARSDLKYMPFAGGTFTGAVTFSEKATFSKYTDLSGINLKAGTEISMPGSMVTFTEYVSGNSLYFYSGNANGSFQFMGAKATFNKGIAIPNGYGISFPNSSYINFENTKDIAVKAYDAVKMESPVLFKGAYNSFTGSAYYSSAPTFNADTNACSFAHKGYVDTEVGSVNDSLISYKVEHNEKYEEVKSQSDTNKTDIATINTKIADNDLSYNSSTGVITMKVNGKTYSIDLPLEKAGVSFAVNNLGELVVTNSDGTTTKYDMKALISQHKVQSGDGNEIVVVSYNGLTDSISIKDHSIGLDQLYTGFTDKWDELQGEFTKAQADRTSAFNATMGTYQTSFNGWQSAESLRASAETARATAETARAEAEQGRVSAENQRAGAESQRASAFTANEGTSSSTDSTSRWGIFKTNEAERERQFQSAKSAIAIADADESKNYSWQIKIENGKPVLYYE